MNGEQLTLLPAESLASLSVWPGSRQAQQMTATSGQRLLASLPSCDRGLSWLRTLVASSAWRSTMCLLTWQHRVTPQGRSYYLLRASVPRTSEIEYGPWPTPNAEGGTGYMSGSARDTWRPTLEGAVRLAPEGPPPRIVAGQSPIAERGERPTKDRMWPTPRHEGFDAGAHRGKPDSLHSAVKMFPAPDAGMVQGGRTLPEGTSPTGMTPDGKKRQVGLTNAVKMLPTPRAIYGEHPGMTDPRHLTGAAMLPTPTCQAAKHSEPTDYEKENRRSDLHVVVSGKLNPAWVSRMMGFPDNYLEL